MSLDIAALEKQEFNLKKGTKIALCVSQYHSNITYKMRDLCRRTLIDYGIDEKHISVYESYGAFELPYLANKVAQKADVDAIITIGAIIKGGTPHFDFVALGTTEGIIKVSLERNLPVIFGVLTTENLSQAKDRIVKGQEVALAALKLLSLNL